MPHPNEMDVEVSVFDAGEGIKLLKVKRVGERNTHLFWLTRNEAVNLAAQIERHIREKLI